MQGVANKPMTRSPFPDCLPQDQELMLGVDFSNAALTATLQARDCGIGHTLRVLHSIELGAGKLFEVDGWHEQLVHALSRVTALPVEDSRFSRIDRITQLVLFGDAARDIRFREALRELFNSRYDELMSSARDDGNPARDPLFLGAVTAAHRNWDYHHHHHRLASKDGREKSETYLRFFLQLVDRVVNTCDVLSHEWYWPKLFDFVGHTRVKFHNLFRSAEANKSELAAEGLEEGPAHYPTMIDPP
jgi:hypothetical protein